MDVLAYGADVRRGLAGDLGHFPSSVVPRGRPGQLGRHRPDGAVVGGGVAARRGDAGSCRWPRAFQVGRPVRGGVQSPVQPGPDRAVAGAAGVAAGPGHARAVPHPAARSGDAHDRDDRGGPGVSRLPRDRHRCRPGPGGRALAAGLSGGEDLAGRRRRGVQGRRLRHRDRQPGANRADCHSWHAADMATGTQDNPRRTRARRRREAAAHQWPDPGRRCQAAGSGPGCHLRSPT